ncbi:MAG: peroxiredoxin [Rhodospirillales bacterium]|nr:peroxiredoxin [Rhodospirillales bacterium]
MTIGLGDRIPSVTLKVMGSEGIEDVDTDSLFKGKRVALFAVPGAFTPTCSAQHLPGFVDNAAALKAKGVDEIVCLSVNDAFVMDAWGKAHNTGDKVKMVADGNAQLTQALGFELDASGAGLGTRSRRYSMIVENGQVKVLNAEAAGAFEVSSAEHMLSQL